ncbi:GNAT family N-acetyltransferase [Plantibacter sp. Mn2098]|uniref:GNAT family N-acetyltransferase n=1 Tax=Plantibacter sp. Mn2098 TaxID=3395266 RepID=UPI003BCFAB43
MLGPADVWPLHEVRLRTPRLELRPARDEDLPGLASAALAGVHDPDRNPFAVPWTAVPPTELPRNVAQFHWGLRAALTRESWHVEFAILHDGVVIGSQGVSATAFIERRTVETGSWLTRDAQGRGFGKEMRAAILLFAFDVLGAEVAETAAADWNEASIGVSRALGYTQSGQTRAARHADSPNTERYFRLERASLVRPEWTLDVSGAAAARAMLV